MSVCVCVCVCVSIASPISKTSDAIAINFDTVTASGLRMHHVLIILTLTFIQVHTHLNHENTTYSIIWQTVQALPIKFAVKIVRLKVNIIASRITFTFTQGHNHVSNFTNVNLYFNSDISDTV